MLLSARQAMITLEQVMEGIAHYLRTKKLRRDAATGNRLSDEYGVLEVTPLPLSE